MNSWEIYSTQLLHLESDYLQPFKRPLLLPYPKYLKPPKVPILKHSESLKKVHIAQPVFLRPMLFRLPLYRALYRKTCSSSKSHMIRNSHFLVTTNPTNPPQDGEDTLEESLLGHNTELRTFSLDVNVLVRLKTVVCCTTTCPRNFHLLHFCATSYLPLSESHH